jgi:LacI family transcriptional regulator
VKKPRAKRATVTAREVAKAAGVSTGTVSRVINAHPAVAEDVRKKVLAAIESLDWRPNAVARSMRTASTRTIGCVFSDVRNPLYAAIIQGAEEALAAEDYTLMVASSSGDPTREARLIQLFASRRADGLILSIADEENKNIIAAVATSRLPTVLVERNLPLDVYSVGTDHRGGMRRAVEYLFSLGHERIALITGGQRTRAGRERLGGYVDAYKAARKMPLPEMLRLESLSSEYAFSETQALLSMKNPPTAIIAGGNLMLAGVLRATHMLNVRIPRDLSIICSGDTELAELATPPVTAVRWDLGAVGREAAKLLIGRLGGASVSPCARIEVPNEIVLRKSCASPRRA